MIAVGDQVAQQLGILPIALREMIVGMTVIALGNRTVFAEIVDADHLVTGLQQLLDQIAADTTSKTAFNEALKRVAKSLPPKPQKPAPKKSRG